MLSILVKWGSQPNKLRKFGEKYLDIKKPKSLLMANSTGNLYPNEDGDLKNKVIDIFGRTYSYASKFCSKYY